MEHASHEDLLIRYLSPDLERAAGGSLPELTDAGWEELVRLAGAQRCRPQLFRALDAPELAGALPRPVFEKLREAYLNNAARNLRLYGELAQIVKALREDDVRVIVLKGAYLARFVYGNIALRFMRDLDLLVHYRDVPKVIEGLVGLGYEPSKEVVLAAAPPPSHQLPQFMKGTDLRVEVHWTIEPEGATVSVDSEQLWARAIPVRVDDADAWALSPDDLLLHLCVHAAYNHKFTMGLRPYLDIVEVIRHLGPALDWEQVQRRAERWGSGRGVYLVLRLARDLLGADVPDFVLERLQPEDVDPSILRAAKTQIFADKVLDNTALPKLADLHDRGSAWGTLKAMWRRAFPTAVYMSWHYPLAPGSSKILFYYLVRWKEGLPAYARILVSLLRGDSAAAEWAGNRSKLSSWLTGAG